MDTRRWIIVLAVSAVAVGTTLAVAVNVAISPWTASWARGSAWFVTGVAAGVVVGLAVWQGVWQRRDARRAAENGFAVARETLLEEAVVEAERYAPTEDLSVWRDGVPTPVRTLEAWFTKAPHSLLVLGEPGAGKSTLLARLARRQAELAREDPEHPAPVLLNLASWGVPERTLGSWVADGLRRRYAISPAAARGILRPGRSCLLLDGLDELPPLDREGCVEEINAFLAKYPSTPIVVASRTAEYDEIPVNLAIDAIVTPELPVIPPEDLKRNGGLDAGSDIDSDLPSTRAPFPRTRSAGGTEISREGEPAEEFLGAPEAPEDEPEPEAEEPPQESGKGPRTARGDRLAVLEQRVLAVLDDQVSQDELQIASAARITPGETARTLARLRERGLVAPASRRSLPDRREDLRYVKR